MAAVYRLCWFRVADVCMSGDIGRLEGRSPKEFEVGDGPCIRPSKYILRSSVIGCVSKHKSIKMRCHEGMFCSEIEVFQQEKGYIQFYTCMLHNIRFIAETAKRQTRYGIILCICIYIERDRQTETDRQTERDTDKETEK